VRAVGGCGEVGSQAVVAATRLRLSKSPLMMVAAMVAVHMMATKAAARVGLGGRKGGRRLAPG
jgi:hypothetical protein